MATPHSLDQARASVLQEATEGHQTLFLVGVERHDLTQVLAERLLSLIRAGVPGYSILVLTPEHRRSRVYERLCQAPELGPFASVQVQTFYGLAHQMVHLFWPWVAETLALPQPQRPAVYLTYETAQYTMAETLAPYLEQGVFADLNLRPQRLVSQLLDNLNKAAVNAYPLEQVEARLRAAWTGERHRLQDYHQAQQCIEAFRTTCRQRGWLDFSLILEGFRALMDHPPFQRFLRDRYRHLLVEGLEESVPLAQDWLTQHLPTCESALLAWNPEGGYRTFLGAAPTSAGRLRDLCQQVVELESPPLASGIGAFIDGLRAFVLRQTFSQLPTLPKGVQLLLRRYRAEMIDAAIQALERRIAGGLPPDQIALVAPYIDGVLAFSLSKRLAQTGIPHTLERRSQSLREDPWIRAVLTLATLAHPDWQRRPAEFAIATALERVLPQLDPLRATLLAQCLTRPAGFGLQPVTDLTEGERQRIGQEPLVAYQRLWAWLETYSNETPLPLDAFLCRLFAEVLSGPDLQPSQARAYTQLVESVKRFRELGPALGWDDLTAGRAYLDLVDQGVVAAQYALDGPDVSQGVLISPIYPYLLGEHRHRLQFWLDVGSSDWWSPPQQILTHPVVLGREWPAGREWTPEDDLARRQRILLQITQGLGRACDGELILCASELDSGGNPMDSLLLRAAQWLLKTDPETLGSVSFMANSKL